MLIGSLVREYCVVIKPSNSSITGFDFNLYFTLTKLGLFRPISLLLPVDAMLVLSLGLLCMMLLVLFHLEISESNNHTDLLCKLIA